MKKEKLRKKIKKITLFDVLVYGISGIMLIIVAYPLVLVLSNSISDPGMVASGQVVLLPKGINLDGYKAVFKNTDIKVGYANTIFYTVFGTLINLVVTLPAAYALTKRSVPGRNLIMTMFMITMYFSGGMIPTFLLVRNLGLYNSRWSILLLGAFSTYYCIVCRSFFESLPKELEESAMIDGCSPMKAFIQVVLPLSKALIGVMVLYYAVGHWNSYFNEMIYLNDDAKQPLQVILRRMLILAQTAMDMDEGGEYALSLVKREALLRYAVIVVSSFPLLITYPFIQKYFDQGVLIGSVKG